MEDLLHLELKNSVSELDLLNDMDLVIESQPSVVKVEFFQMHSVLYQEVDKSLLKRLHRLQLFFLYFDNILEKIHFVKYHSNLDEYLVES